MVELVGMTVGEEEKSVGMMRVERGSRGKDTTWDLSMRRVCEYRERRVPRGITDFVTRYRLDSVPQDACDGMGNRDGSDECRWMTDPPGLKPGIG